MNRLRVLLVDDDADHRELLRLSLSRAPDRPELTTVASREMMLEAIATHPFDCVVLDFNIPPYTATDLIRDLNTTLPDTPVLVISSSEDQRVVVDSFRSGVADFVPKDVAFGSGELARRISAVAAAARRRRRDRRLSTRRLRSLERWASTDPLTGLHNRRQVERFLCLSQTRGERRVATGVVMVDIDLFKSVNDTYGHAAGDQVLRAVAAILRQSAQPSDVLARWGGEEFVLFRPSAAMADLWEWAERVRAAIAERAIRVMDRDIRVTASLGLTVIPTADLEASGISQADRAMYLAKDLGRNRTCSWTMLCAMEQAEQVQSEPSDSPRQRLTALRGRLLPSLGPTQRNHVCEHSAAVAAVAVALGQALCMSPEEIRTLALAAEFHDIGKAVIPEDVLGSANRLNHPERKLVNEHARAGAELLHAAGAESSVEALVGAHHARFDDPKASRDLPLMTLCVADALVSMISERPYAPAKSMAEAIRELRSQRGRQFDPRVVDAVVEIKATAGAVGGAGRVSLPAGSAIQLAFELFGVY